MFGLFRRNKAMKTPRGDSTSYPETGQLQQNQAPHSIVAFSAPATTSSPAIPTQSAMTPAQGAGPFDQASAAIAHLRRLMYGFKTTVLLGIAARYHLAEELAHGPRTSAEIAQTKGLLDTEALRQAMLGLAAFGILRHEGDDRFSLTALGAYLLPDHAESVFAEAWLADQVLYKAYTGLPHAIETGQPSFDSVFGEPFFAYLDAHPEIAMRFGQFLGASAKQTAKQVARVYRFADAAHPKPLVVDVGGGAGTFLIEIVTADPNVTGALIDNPHVIPRAQATIAAAGLSDAITTYPGDFFQPLGVTGDVILLSQILHDWNDDQCRVILGNCVAALRDQGRILIIDAQMPDQITEPGFAIDQSLNMVALMYGRERSEREFRALFDSVGLQLQSMTPVPPFTIFEAIPLAQS